MIAYFATWHAYAMSYNRDMETGGDRSGTSLDQNTQQHRKWRPVMGKALRSLRPKIPSTNTGRDYWKSITGYEPKSYVREWDVGTFDDRVARGLVAPGMTKELATSPLVESEMSKVEALRGENEIYYDGTTDGLSADITLAAGGEYFRNAETMARYRGDLGDLVVLNVLSGLDKALRAIERPTTIREKETNDAFIESLKRGNGELVGASPARVERKARRVLWDQKGVDYEAGRTIEELRDEDINSILTLGRKAIIHHRQRIPNAGLPSLDISVQREAFVRLCGAYADAFSNGQAYLSFASRMIDGRGMEGITPQDEANAHAYVDIICHRISQIGRR